MNSSLLVVQVLTIIFKRDKGLWKSNHTVETHSTSEFQQEVPNSVTMLMKMVRHQCGLVVPDFEGRSSRRTPRMPVRVEMTMQRVTPGSRGRGERPVRVVVQLMHTVAWPQDQQAPRQTPTDKPVHMSNNQ